MVEAIIGLVGVVAGSIGLEVFRKFLNRKRDRNSDLIVVLEQLRKDYERVRDSRSEYAQEIEKMGSKIIELTEQTEGKLEERRKELAEWRDKYYGVLDQLIETQNELHSFLGNSKRKIDKLDE